MTSENRCTRAVGHVIHRARYYNPATGTFNQRDTFAGNNFDPQSLHKYTYCHCDPVNGLDPSGYAITLTEVLVVAFIGAIIGALAAGAVAEAQGRVVTTREILWGAGLGAAFGVLALLAAPIALGLGLGGVVYAGMSFGPILFDPGASSAQKRASLVLIAASIYGAYGGIKMARARVSEFDNAPTQPSGDEVVLEHGTTLERALSIFHKGPNENFVEPGGFKAEGFSTARVNSPSEPIGSARQYATDKVTALEETNFPNEGGPAILRIAVPKSIFLKAIRVGNEVRFEKGFGLEELQAAWAKNGVYVFPPKKL